MGSIPVSFQTAPSSFLSKKPSSLLSYPDKSPDTSRKARTSALLTPILTSQTLTPELEPSEFKGTPLYPPIFQTVPLELEEVVLVLPEEDGAEGFISGLGGSFFVPTPAVSIVVKLPS